MPAIKSVGRANRDFMYGDVSPSVVSLLRCYKDSGDYIDFGSGFVLHDNGSKTVILTSAAVFDEDEESITVCFADGTVRQASIFISDVRSVYTSLVVDSTASSKPVVFDDSAIGRGDFVFAVARVLPEIRRPGMFTGTVIHPRCISVNRHSGKPVNKYDDYFALSCPVAGPCKGLQRLGTMLRLIGSPVFNSDTQVVGVIEQSSETKYDVKFARISSSVIDELRILFDDSDWKGALERQLMNMTS